MPFGIEQLNGNNLEKKKTSIHFEACNIAKSEIHNLRKQYLDYIFSELSEDNESMYLDHRNLRDIEKEIQTIYKEKVGRKMPSNTVPIREAVVVIDENTTMFDLQKLSNEIEKLFHWKPLQIHIHRDEGHVNSSKKVLNLHAHLVFNCQDQVTGKMHKIDKLKLSQLQTITAEVLEMERGQRSSRKHLKSLDFKIEKKEEQLKELNQKLDKSKDWVKIYDNSIVELEKMKNELEEEVKNLRRTKYKIDDNLKLLDKLEKEGIDKLEEVYDAMYSNRVKRKRDF